jgi:hypothetical protein
VVGLRGVVLPNGGFMATWYLVLPGAAVLLLLMTLGLVRAGSFRSAPPTRILPRSAGHWLLVLVLMGAVIGLFGV